MHHECFCFKNLCFILKILRWLHFFCGSTSKYLTSTFRVSQSWVGGDAYAWEGEEKGDAPLCMCNFFIWWAAYPTGHHLYINLHFPLTLILWKFCHYFFLDLVKNEILNTFNFLFSEAQLFLQIKILLIAP